VTIDPIYVCFNVEERALLEYRALVLASGKKLRPGRLKEMGFPIEIGLVTEEGFPHRGVLDFADNKIDRGTGTIRVRGEFQNDNEYLTPGMFVRVRIPFGDSHPALMVDERAVGTDQRIKYLLTVNKENKVERRDVTLGRLQDGLQVIRSGIGADDRVIVSGLQRAIPGDTVAPHLAGEKRLAATN
jgi:membrane fusion protein, multidrug efflux system